MHAIEIATRLIVGPGDEALIPTPAWPNFVGALEISGARAVPVPARQTGPLEPRSRQAREGGHAGDQTHLLQHPRQPDRLRRHARRDRRDARDRAPAWALDHRRRDLRAPHLRRRPRAFVPRRDGARRQDPVRPDFVQELGDDRFPHRLARGAAGARPCHRESRPVHDVGRARVQSARGDGGARTGRNVPRLADRALPPLARHPVRGAGEDRTRSLLQSRRRRSICSFRSTAFPIRRRLRSSSSTKPASAPRPGAPSAPAAKAICGFASPAIPNRSPKRRAAWRGGSRLRARSRPARRQGTRRHVAKRRQCRRR